MENALSNPVVDPVSTIVQQMRDGLTYLHQYVEVARPALEAGFSLAELRGVTGADCQALFDVAGQLCDAGKFDDALPIALHLAVYQPSDSRYSYLAGVCLHHAGRLKEAATMYGLSVMADPQPGTLYCLGRCQLALCDKEKAAEAFETAYELCRGEDRHRDLQDQCEKALKQVAGR